jgi:hypothetical protein
MAIYLEPDENALDQTEAADENPELNLDNAELTEEPAEDNLEDSLADTEEETKDINEAVALFLYNAFTEIKDTMAIYLEPDENGDDAKDKDLVEALELFTEKVAEDYTFVTEIAKKFVKSVELFDPEEGEVINEPEETEKDKEDTEEELNEECELVDLKSLLESEGFDVYENANEYDIFFRYKDSAEADQVTLKLEAARDSGILNLVDVKNYSDTGEIHAIVKMI